MSLLGVVLLLALLAVPVIVVLGDSPVGRALARRIGGPDQPAPNTQELARKVELLEGEMDDLQRAVEQLQEENQFLQRLIEDHPAPRSLPRRSAD